MDLPLDSIICHDVVKPFPLPDQCIDVVITSPPYWGLRDYGVKSIFGGDPNCKHKWSEEKTGLTHENRNFQKGSQEEVVGQKGTTWIRKYDEISSGFCQICGAWLGQLGLENHPQMFIDHLVLICREIKRVLKKSGSFYLNLGDTYCSFGGLSTPEQNAKSMIGATKSGCQKGARYITDLKKIKSNWLQPKQLMLMPSRVAIALQDDGWILRSDIIWHKPNPMPSSVKDRLNNTFEHVFHFVKDRKYYYDLDSIRVPHKRDFSIESGFKDGGYKPKNDAWKHDPLMMRGKNAIFYYDPLGKNPGDVVNTGRAGFHPPNRSSPTIYDGQLNWHTKKHNNNPKGKNPGDFWNITTQPFTGYNPDLEHFAVFPEELLIKPLKASCPKEICKKCGKPRIRILEKGELVSSSPDIPMAIKPRAFAQNKKIKQDLPKDPYGSLPKRLTNTVGWSDCGCGVGFDSGVVLDPFAGRGTVGKVAKQLGLHYILFDIKPEYCELSQLYIGGQKHKLHRDQSKLNL